MDQILFDFGRRERSEAALRDLDKQLQSLGLLSNERKVLCYLWQHGRFHSNRSGMVISLAKLAKGIGFSLSWTRYARDNLVAFRLLHEVDNGPGKPKSYVVCWADVRSASTVRELLELDPFAGFDAMQPQPKPEAVDIDLSTPPGSSPDGVVTTPLTPTQRGALDGALDGAVSSSEDNNNPPHNSLTHSKSTEGWGFEIQKPDLRNWDVRTKCWRRAREINRTIEETREERLGFIAAVLCALEKAEEPGAMLLSFVRRAAWRKRGMGGIDGFWLHKAKDALRCREREKRELAEMIGAS